MNIKKCKFCGAPIVWLETQNGRPMPCDANAVKYQINYKGKDIIVTPEGKVIRASVVEAVGGNGLTPVVDGEGYISHFATCPFADKARHKKASEGISAPQTADEITTAAPVHHAVNRVATHYTPEAYGAPPPEHKPIPPPAYDPTDIECMADEYEKFDAARRERRKW